MNTLPTTVVVVDPSAPDGEAGLAFLAPADDHVAVLCMVGGPTAAALQQFAAAESVDLVTAGWIYLDQVSERASAPGRIVMELLADGPSLLREVSDFSRTHTVRRILVPGSIERVDPRAVHELRMSTSAPIAVVTAPATVG